jgi:hypothetical protein
MSFKKNYFLAATAMLALSMTSTSGNAADKFFCTAERSTGFKFLNEAWVQTAFKIDADKYVVQRVPRPYEQFGETISWEVKKVGEQMPAFQCRDSGETRIICGGLGWGFIMNPKMLRYQEFYGMGFIDGDSAENTPALTLGKCVQLE